MTEIWLKRPPRIGDAVTYCLHLRDYLWIMPAQVVGYYEHDPVSSRPVVSVTYYDSWGLLREPIVKRGLLSQLIRPDKRPEPGWHRAIQLLHWKNWIGDVPEEFWMWPEEAPMVTSIALPPGHDWRERLSEYVEHDRQAVLRDRRTQPRGI